MTLIASSGRLKNIIEYNTELRHTGPTSKESKKNTATVFGARSSLMTHIMSAEIFKFSDVAFRLAPTIGGLLVPLWLFTDCQQTKC